MAQIAAYDLACRRIPDLYGSVHAAAGEALAVRTVDDAENFVGVAVEGARDLVGRQIPDLQRSVVAGGGQVFAVRAAEVDDFVRVPLQGAHVAVTEPPQVVPLEAAQVRI